MRAKREKIIIGNKYHYLTVLSYSHQDSRWRKYYNVRCDCGNEFVVKGSSFVSNNTKSCGCYGKIVRKTKFLLPNNLGIKRMIIKQYTRHAKDRGIEYGLSEETFIKLIELPCYYCGLEKSNTAKSKNYKQGYQYNGIDRIDSNKGYFEDNCVPCCSQCNKAKMAMSRDEFLNWINRVYKYSCEVI